VNEGLHTYSATAGAANHETRRQDFAFRGLAVHRAQQAVDERLARKTCVLHHCRERRICEACGWDIVEPDDRNRTWHIDTSLLQGAQRANGDEVARGDNRVEELAAREQLARGLVARLLHRDRIDLQRRAHGLARRSQRFTVAAIALEEFRIVTRGAAEKCDLATTEPQQVLGRLPSAVEVVAAD